MKHHLARGCSIHTACLWAEKGRWRAALGQARDSSTAPLSLLPSLSWGYSERQCATTTPFPVLFPHGGCTTARLLLHLRGFHTLLSLATARSSRQAQLVARPHPQGTPSLTPWSFQPWQQTNISSQFSIPARPDLFKLGCLGLGVCWTPSLKDSAHDERLAKS